MRIKLIVMLLVMATTAAAAAPQAIEQLSLFQSGAQTDKAVSTENEFRWSGRVEAGRAVEIKGVNGNIKAEPASGNEVEVVAQKQGKRSKVQDVQVKVVEHEGGVTICAVYPSTGGKDANDCRPGKDWSVNINDNDVLVDFTVRVPQGVRLSAYTVNGEIETGLIGSNVEANTVNGSIRIAATGYAQAKTINGSINATLGNANWTGTLDFKTINGEITLNLPADTSADVRAETLNGDISTDFQMTIQGRITGKRLTGTIGSGGRALDLKTINGSIRLRRAS